MYFCSLGQNFDTKNILALDKKDFVTAEGRDIRLALIFFSFQNFLSVWFMFPMTMDHQIKKTVLQIMKVPNALKQPSSYKYKIWGEEPIKQFQTLQILTTYVCTFMMPTSGFWTRIGGKFFDFSHCQGQHFGFNANSMYGWEDGII